MEEEREGREASGCACTASRCGGGGVVHVPPSQQARNGGKKRSMGAVGGGLQNPAKNATKTVLPAPWLHRLICLNKEKKKWWWWWREGWREEEDAEK